LQGETPSKDKTLAQKEAVEGGEAFPKKEKADLMKKIPREKETLAETSQNL